MANNNQFRARMGAITAEIMGATEATMRGAVQDLAEEANTRKQDGGLLPFLNGHLQNSFKAQSPSGGEAFYPSQGDVIAKTKLGDTILLSWGVIYDRTQEYGDPSRNIPANAFARTAVAKFPMFIKNNGG